MAPKRLIKRWASSRLAVRHAGLLEISAGLVAASVLVFVAQHLPASVASLLGALHLGYPLALLNGTIEPTDIGLNVAQTKAWLHPGLSAYAPMKDALPLIGASWQGGEPHTHLPMELPLFIPLTFFRHAEWVPFWAAVMLLSMAWSLRLMSVRPRYAYAIACVVAATPPGYYALQSTYPMIAAALAFAWRAATDRRPARAALAIVLAGAGRAIGLVPLLYFASERRWRGLVVPGLTLLALTGIALAVEPGIPGAITSILLPAVDRTVMRPDNIALTAAFARSGSSWSAIVLAGIGALMIVLARVPQLRFMAFVWGSVAASPIAWSYTWAQALPLLAFTYSLGRVGRVGTLVAAVAVVTLTKTEGLGWWVFVISMAIPLVARAWAYAANAKIAPSVAAA